MQRAPLPRLGRTALLILPLALLSLVACSGDADPDEMQPPATEPAAETADEQPTAGEDMTHQTVPLAAVNESGVSGEAMGMHSDDAVVMMLELEGLPAEGEYAAHIHSGSCADGGSVAVALDPVIGLADGTGASTTTLEPDAIDPDSDHFVQVHGEGGTPIACGDVEGHGT